MHWEVEGTGAARLSVTSERERQRVTRVSARSGAAGVWFGALEVCSEAKLTTPLTGHTQVHAGGWA